MSFVRRRIGCQPKVRQCRYTSYVVVAGRPFHVFSFQVWPCALTQLPPARPEAEPKTSGDLDSGCGSEICKARKREDAVACFLGMGPTPPPGIYSSSHKRENHKKHAKGDRRHGAAGGEFKDGVHKCIFDDVNSNHSLFSGQRLSWLC